MPPADPALPAAICSVGFAAFLDLACLGCDVADVGFGPGEEDFDGIATRSTAETIQNHFYKHRNEVEWKTRERREVVIKISKLDGELGLTYEGVTAAGV